MTCGECQYYLAFDRPERPGEEWGHCHANPPTPLHVEGVGFPYCDRPIVAVNDLACRFYSGEQRLHTMRTMEEIALRNGFRLADGQLIQIDV